MTAKGRKAPHTRHFEKTLVPDDIRRGVIRLNRNIASTAALLGVSIGSVEELRNVGGALMEATIEQVRHRLAELAQKESA